MSLNDSTVFKNIKMSSVRIDKLKEEILALETQRDRDVKMIDKLKTALPALETQRDKIVRIVKKPCGCDSCTGKPFSPPYWGCD